MTQTHEKRQQGLFGAGGLTVLGSTSRFIDPAKGDRTVQNPLKIDDLSDDALDAMLDNATAATNFLKAIGHEGRLMILCHLATGEKSVTELEELLSARQAAVSQQLGRLRLEGLVAPRREGKTIYYSLTDERCKRIIPVLYDLFCT
jgi:ArsR family transcriptional regulator